MKNCYIVQIPDKVENFPSIAIADLTNRGEMVPGSMTITRINTPAAHRGLGFGSQLLKQICQDADEDGVILSLEIHASGPMDREDLENWYIRYGFFLDRSTGVYLRMPGADIRPVHEGFPV